MSERYLTAGPLRLDLRDQRLYVAGVAVRIGGKAMSLLEVLMDRPQILLTKAELFAAVWPDLAVSDAVLTTAIKELRQAIGDSARRPLFIETAHGRGYRFLLPVLRSDLAEAPAIDLLLTSPVDPRPKAEPSEHRPRPRPRHRVWMAVGVTICLAVAALVAGPGLPDWRRPETAVTDASSSKSIVVLPFEDFSPAGDQRWFADGLAEEVQTTLARTPDLRLLSRASAARLSGTGASGQQVAANLGAAQFLEGSVRRTGDRIRVTAKLIRTADGSELWSQNYDRDMRDVISIQEDIAFQIASALKTVMDPARLRVMVASGTRSVEAYEAYLEGLSLDQRQLEQGDLAFASTAADAYERARAIDPNFAAAHWRAARTWFGNATRVDSTTRDSTPDAVRLARYLERVDAAIATSRDDVEKRKYEAGRTAMALQFRHAHRLMSEYLAARPRDIDAWEEMADLSAYAGDRDGMRRAAERIHSLSVEEGNPRSRAITVSVMALDMDAAVVRARQHLELRPDHALTQYQAHRALIWAGQIDEARALLPRIRASRMPTTSRLLAALRQACADGNVVEAKALRVEIDGSDGLSSRWQAAQIAGDPVAAAALLRPLDQPDGLPTLMQFMINPTFDPTLYPLLKSRLIRNGIPIRPALAMPFACPGVP